MVGVLTKSIDFPLSIHPIISDCGHMMVQFQQLHVRHIVREGNRSADCLANLAVDQNEDFVVHLLPPKDVCNICLDDV